MKFLENALKFTFKNFILCLPLLFVYVIPNIIIGIGSMFFMVNYLGQIEKIVDQMTANPNFVPGLDFIVDIYGMPFLLSIIIALAITLVLTIIFTPATYGMVSKKLQTGSASLKDVMPSMSKFVGRYVLFLLMNVVFVLGILIVFAIFMALSVFLMISVLPLGIMLLFISFIGYLFVLLLYSAACGMWFPAVCTEDCGIMEGLKYCFKALKGTFWRVFGIMLLVSLCTGVASMFFSWIPVLGTMAAGGVSALSSFVLIVYYFQVYRARTGRPVIFDMQNAGSINNNYINQQALNKYSNLNQGAANNMQASKDEVRDNDNVTSEVDNSYKVDVQTDDNSATTYSQQDDSSASSDSQQDDSSTATDSQQDDSSAATDRQQDGNSTENK